MKTKRVFTKKLAMELQRYGFPIIRIERNKNNKRLLVYTFEDTPIFRKVFSAVSHTL